jgi:hypothetical protein
VGRIAFTGRYGLSIFPVNYKVYEGSIVFRTAGDSPFGEDLRTGVQYTEYKVAFEIDHLDPAAREGWSMLIHGLAHHMDTSAERALAEEIGGRTLGEWETRRRRAHHPDPHHRPSHPPGELILTRPPAPQAAARAIRARCRRRRPGRS